MKLYYITVFYEVSASAVILSGINLCGISRFWYTRSSHRMLIRSSWWFYGILVGARGGNILGWWLELSH